METVKINITKHQIWAKGGKNSLNRLRLSADTVSSYGLGPL